jgi:hypothetical protein
MPTFTSCIKRYDSSAFRVFSRLIICLCLSTFAGAQHQPPVPTEDRTDKPFPATPRQLEDILKADHEQNLKDLDKLARLVEAVQADARRNAHYVLSVQSLRSLEQIEKLSKTIRARMKRD